MMICELTAERRQRELVVSMRIPTAPTTVLNTRRVRPQQRQHTLKAKRMILTTAILDARRITPAETHAMFLGSHSQLEMKMSLVNQRQKSLSWEMLGKVVVNPDAPSSKAKTVNLDTTAHANGRRLVLPCLAATLSHWIFHLMQLIQHTNILLSKVRMILAQGPITTLFRV